MVCIYCGADTKVTNSRLQKRSNQVWRRRECINCQSIFTTEEIAQYERVWLVKDSSGHPKPFSRDKLFVSLLSSCEHRKNSVSDAAALVETVIKNLSQNTKTLSIGSEQIKLACEVTLNRFDRVASSHYRAFHS